MPCCILSTDLDADLLWEGDPFPLQPSPDMTFRAGIDPAVRLSTRRRLSNRDAAYRVQSSDYALFLAEQPSFIS